MENTLKEDFLIFSATICFSPPNKIKWRRKEVDGGERI